MSVLNEIFARRRQDVHAQQQSVPAAELRARLRELPSPRDFESALRSQPGIAVIAELKFRSPSEGILRGDGTVADIARGYATAGAATLSVLTEPEYFGGCLENLSRARAAVSLPVLRKDFIFDEYQIVESRVHGADAILLIAAALERPAIVDLAACAHELGLSVLLEIHDEHDLRKCAGLNQVIWGINHRDLKTLKVDLDLSLRLRAALPVGATCVAESGISRRAELLLMQERGFQAALIGSSLMKSPSPGAALAELLGRD